MTPAQKTDAVINAAVDSMYRNSVRNWFLRYGVLKDIKGIETRYPALKLRVVQERMFTHHDACLMAKVPCKQIVLKPRKDGASTGGQGIMYHRLRRFSGRDGAIMGDVAGTSDTVFNIFRTFGEQDSFNWNDGYGNLRIGDRENNLTDDITLPNRSTYKKVTAGSSNANRSGTIQMANSTETAYYQRIGERDPLVGFLGSWYEHADSSYALMDSTSNGPFGSFHDYFMDDRNGWEKIFVAWFEEPDHRLEFATVGEEQKFRMEMDRDEHDLIDRFALTLPQLKWRRDKLYNKCGGNVEQLNKEYPPTIEEAFLQKSSLRFNIRVLEVMEQYARVRVPEIGELVTQPDSEAVSFQPDPNGTVKIFEQPKYGCKYLGAFDGATGKDQQSKKVSADPDFHAAGILRDEYLDAANGQHYPPMIVASYRSRVEAEVAAATAAGMSRHYGLCPFVVETNGCGLYPVKELARLGIPLWQRKQKNDRNQDILADGWYTDQVLRKTIIDMLGGMIGRWTPEAPTFELWDMQIISELKKMINKDGRAEAMPGAHDDTVLMLAIALYNRACASVMREPQRKKVSLTKLFSREGWR